MLFTAELSTPLLNLRWILRWVAQYTGRMAPLILSLAFVALFFASRICLYGALMLDLVKVSFSPQVSLQCVLSCSNEHGMAVCMYMHVSSQHVQGFACEGSRM